MCGGDGDDGGGGDDGDGGGDDGDGGSGETEKREGREGEGGGHLEPDWSVMLPGRGEGRPGSPSDLPAM